MQIKLGTDFKANVEQALKPEQKKKQEKGKEDFETRFSHCSKVSVDPIYPPKVSSIGNKGHLAKAVTMSKCNVWFILSVILWNLSILCHSRRELQNNCRQIVSIKFTTCCQECGGNLVSTSASRNYNANWTFSNINFAQFSLLKKSKKSRELLSIWMSTLQKYENEWFTNPKMWRKLTEIRLKAPRPPVRVSIIGRSNFLGSEWRGRRRKIEATTSLVGRKSGKPSTNHLWLRLWSGPPTISKIQANHTYMILFQPRLQCVVL